MKAVMLDTDILSEFLRGNPAILSKVEQYLAQFDAINLSIITYYEIMNGLLYKDAKKQLKSFNEFIKVCNILPFTLRSAKVAASIQADLRKKGVQIGHTDTIIAGIAIANDLQLVTNNTSHFKRIEGLDIDNWKK